MTELSKDAPCDLITLVSYYHTLNSRFFRRIEPYRIDGEPCVPEHLHSVQTLHAAMREVSTAGVPWWGVAYHLVLGSLYVACGVAWFVTPLWRAACAFGALGWVWCGYLQHEGCHAAFRSRTANQVARWSIIPWACPRTWFVRHVTKHHVSPNTVDDWDMKSAANPSPFVRHHASLASGALHKLQAWIVPVASMFVCLDYSLLPAMQACWLREPLWGESAAFLGTFGAFIGTSLYLHADPVHAVLPWVVFGLLFGNITQISHIHTDCIPDEAEVKKVDGLVLQGRTCMDYAHGSLWDSITNIWLNYQTYHHCMPRISHFRYHDAHLRAKLDGLLREAKVPLHEERRTWGTLRAYVHYLRHLRRLGIA